MDDVMSFIIQQMMQQETPAGPKAEAEEEVEEEEEEEEEEEKEGDEKEQRVPASAPRIVRRNARPMTRTRSITATGRRSGPTCASLIVAVRHREWRDLIQQFMMLEADSPMAEYAVNLLVEKRADEVPRGLLVQMHGHNSAPIRRHIGRLLPLPTLTPELVAEALLPFCRDFASFLEVGMHHPTLLSAPDRFLAKATALFWTPRCGWVYDALLTHVAETQPTLFTAYLSAARSNTGDPSGLRFSNTLVYLTEGIYKAHLGGRMTSIEFNKRAALLRPLLKADKLGDGIHQVVNTFCGYAFTGTGEASPHFVSLMEVTQGVKLLQALPDFKRQLGSWFSASSRPLFVIPGPCKATYQPTLQNANLDHLIKYLN